MAKTASKFEVWSKEQEEWGPDEEATDAATLTYVHTKSVANVLYDHFQDATGRWFRRPTH